VADQSRERVRTPWLLALIVLAALAARVVLLLHRPLWHDEAFTEWAARLPSPGLAAALRVDSGPPLFYVLERPFARAVTGRENEGLLRVVPFVAALGLFFAATTLPRGSSRRWWIALAASFALVNLYAAEARAYSLLALAGLAIFLLAVVATPSPARLAALFATAAAALWLHYLALFTVGAALLLTLARRRWGPALALAAALSASAPWIPVLRGQPPEAMAWMRETPGAALSGFVSALGGVGRIPAPFGAVPPGFMFAGALLGVALVALLAAAARSDDGVRDAVLFVAIVLGLALAVTLWRPVAFAGRAEMAVLPVWMWAVARAAGRRRSAAAVAGLAAVAGGIATLGVVLGPHARPTPFAAASGVARLARAGDRVLAGPGLYLPALVERARGRLAAEVAALPDRDSSHPGWFVPAAPGVSEERELARAMDSLPGGGHLFLLIPTSYQTPGIMRTLFARGTVREIVRQPDAVLLVWSASATPPS
jgi:hypothetical protein